MSTMNKTFVETSADRRSIMSNSTMQNPTSAQEEAALDRLKAAKSPKKLCQHQGPKKRRTFRSLIVWPLVLLSLIQVTSNLVSHYVQVTPKNQISYLPSQQLLHRRLCQDEELFNGARVAQINENSLISQREALTDEPRLRGPPRELSDSDYYKKNLCSSANKQISSSLLSSSLPTYLTSYVRVVTSNIYTFLSQTRSSTAIFSPPKILLADAAQVSSNSMYQANHEKEIIVLNSTNFNAELIQYNHPFPHIKLIEYYLAYCGICLRFKPTYVQLSKDMNPWRNVIRTSAIDLGVSSNTHIASSWSIDVIPTLRIHPPPNASLSAKLNKQLSALDSKLSQNDQLKSISDSYNAANLSISSLGVTKYTFDAKKEHLADKVSLLKLDLIRYIERYVSEHPDNLPLTWPNLIPVKEKTLVELRQNHPRQELFLLVEAGGIVDSQDPSSASQPSFGLQVMMDLSSTAAFKAARYVRASENRALIEDVIAHKRKESNEQINESQHNTEYKLVPNDQVELLRNFAEGNATAEQRDQVVLIHIDDSHSPRSHSFNAPTNKFRSITIVTKSDLLTAEQLPAGMVPAESTRTRRAMLNHHDTEEMNPQRSLNLIKHFIKQTYIEVQEDREFLAALSSYDENPTSYNLKRDALDKFQATQRENQISLSQSIRKSKQYEQEKGASNSTLKKFLSWFNPASSNSFLSKASESNLNDDYKDKLKAIRYIFFQEVPRKSLADKSSTEKLEKINNLVNLASVIKAYFPLPDLASVQFIDGILSYLTKQQTLLVASIRDQQDRAPGTQLGGSNFDFRALKQVIKNLEAEGKRLPEVKDWQHCKFSGYPCALWRLFHTLTAFEYTKLSQITQQSYSASRQVLRQQNSTAASLTSESQLSSSEPQQGAQVLKPSAAALENNNASPVERLVSPPSTTTSLSLTIATPITAQDHQHATNDNQNSNNNRKQVSESDLPEPVLLVMRDYITNFFSCEECARNFHQEAIELTFERIRRQEPPEFSILWLWETHNRVSKRLSISPDTNSPDHPKKWYPSFGTCPKCYNKPPSYLKDTNVELAAIFHESIDWNREETLNFLVKEFTRQPMDMGANFFGYPVPYGCCYIIVIGICSLLLIIFLRCASCYIERQRRHKASLLNGNGAQYSVELQAR